VTEVVDAALVGLEVCARRWSRVALLLTDISLTGRHVHKKIAY
jgi:hypothetical protein